MIYYPDAAWLHKYVDQNGKVTEFKREVDGCIKTVIDLCGDSVDYQYLRNGRLRKAIHHRPAVPANPLNPASASIVTPYATLATQFAYHPLGELASLTNPLGLELVFNVDECGRRYEWYHNVPNAVTTKYLYDAGDQLIHVIDRKGQRTDHTYWNSGQCKSTQYASWSDGTNSKAGKRINFKKYDYQGQLLTVSDSDIPGDSDFVYDLNGNLVFRRDPDGWELTFSFDADNNLTGVSDSSGAYASLIGRSARDLQIVLA
jgi:YD repeat-containing protein